MYYLNAAVVSSRTPGLRIQACSGIEEIVGIDVGDAAGERGSESRGDLVDGGRRIDICGEGDLCGGCPDIGISSVEIPGDNEVSEADKRPLGDDCANADGPWVQKVDNEPHPRVLIFELYLIHY